MTMSFLKFAPSLVCLGVIWTCSNSAVLAGTRAPIEVTRTPQLFLHDDLLIESRDGVTLVPATVTKHLKNPVLKIDQPWEEGLLLLACVMHDVEEKLYKMWYEVRDAKGEGAMGRCHYAVSKDGLNWTKPILNVVKYKGSTANNIVFAGPNGKRSKTYWVTKDHSESDPAKRYKMMYHQWDFRGRGVGIACSPDGIRWTGNAYTALTGGFDTQNIMFWDDRVGQFVGYLRNWVGQRRAVSRATSHDGFRWSQPETVFGPDENDPPKGWDIYTPGVFKYSKADNVYIMVPAAYEYAPSSALYGQLGVSRDGINWHRFRTPFMPRGAAGEWDTEGIYPVPSEATINGKVALYYFGSDGKHVTGGYDTARNGIGVMFAREGGFAGWRAEGRGTITTQPLAVNHARYRFYLNADAAAGSIEAELLDANNQVIAALGRGEAKPIQKDGNRLMVAWKNPKAAVALRDALRNGPVKLRLHLQNATVYGFECGEPPGGKEGQETPDGE